MAAATETFPLDDFRILGSIGKGEFGKVHRAAWTPHGVDVALKQIEAGQGTAKLEAEREGVRLQALVARHYPDIVPRIYRDGTAANGDYFIAMEFVRGESLHDMLRRTRLQPSEAVRLATVLASNLQRLHGFRPPILHSDLKPEHVLVLDDGSVRIIDFGIARRPESGAATHNAFVSVMYAAPERVEDEARNVHPSDDLWALGVMLFEMLAGQHPLELHRARLVEAADRGDFRAVATLLRERPGPLPAGCSPQLDAIVRKMLAPQPGHRYPSAAQVLADLDNAASGRETMAWQQLLAAGRATRVVPRTATAAPGAPTMAVPPPLPRAAVAATQPNPAPATPAAAARVSGAPTAATQQSATPRPMATIVPPLPPVTQNRPLPARAGRDLRRPWITRRSAGVVLRAIVALLVARAIIGESIVWNRVERFEQRIPTFGMSDLSSIRPMVDSLGRGAMFGFAASRVNGPISDRMLELAEPTIVDFRNDVPTARRPQWRAASAALAIALDLEPGSRRVRSRARYVEGQLLRIDAQGKSPEVARPTLDRAVAAFRDAAELDDEWPDPWIGLAAVHAYGLRDVDEVVKDVDEAARRGFTPGRREHAEVADAFSYRADQARNDAVGATLDERRPLLEAAAADYQACVEHYTGVTEFYNAERNRDRCERLRDAVAEELALAIEPPPEPSEPPAENDFIPAPDAGPGILITQP